MYSLTLIPQPVPIPFQGSAQFISEPSWEAEKLAMDLDLPLDTKIVVDIFDPVRAKNMIDEFANDGSGDDSSICIYGALFRFYGRNAGLIPILENSQFEFLKNEIFKIIQSGTKVSLSFECKIGFNCDLSCNGRMGYIISNPVSISMIR